MLESFPADQRDYNVGVSAATTYNTLRNLGVEATDAGRITMAKLCEIASHHIGRPAHAPQIESQQPDPEPTVEQDNFASLQSSLQIITAPIAATLISRLPGRLPANSVKGKRYSFDWCTERGALLHEYVVQYFYSKTSRHVTTISCSTLLAQGGGRINAHLITEPNGGETLSLSWMRSSSIGARGQNAILHEINPSLQPRLRGLADGNAYGVAITTAKDQGQIQISHTATKEEPRPATVYTYNAQEDVFIGQHNQHLSTLDAIDLAREMAAFIPPTPTFS